MGTNNSKEEATTTVGNYSVYYTVKRYTPADDVIEAEALPQGFIPQHLIHNYGLIIATSTNSRKQVILHRGFFGSAWAHTHNMFLMNQPHYKHDTFTLFGFNALEDQINVEGGGIKCIGGGDNHIMLVTNNNKLYARGNTHCGEFGRSLIHAQVFNDWTEIKCIPAATIPLIQEIYASFYSTILILRDGRVMVAGYLYAKVSHQWGYLNFGKYNVVKKAFVTPNGALFLTPSNEIFAFGNSYFGSLGMDTVGATPKLVTCIPDGVVIRQAAGLMYSSVCFLSTAGQMYITGKLQWHNSPEVVVPVGSLARIEIQNLKEVDSVVGFCQDYLVVIAGNSMYKLTYVQYNPDALLVTTNATFVMRKSNVRQVSCTEFGILVLLDEKPAFSKVVRGLEDLRIELSNDSAQK